jgi:hypothetical protein
MILVDISNNKLKASERGKPPYSLNLEGKVYNYHIEMYDFRNERLMTSLISETGERIFSPENINLKLVIQKAYDSYSKLEKHY